MLMQDVLKYPSRIMTSDQRDRFVEEGSAVVEGVIGADWLADLLQVYPQHSP